jgi:hypothetical protein
MPCSGACCLSITKRTRNNCRRNWAQVRIFCWPPGGGMLDDSPCCTSITASPLQCSQRQQFDSCCDPFHDSVAMRGTRQRCAVRE